MGGKAVAQRMGADTLADARDFGGLLDGAMQLPRRDCQDFRVWTGG